MGNIQYSTVQMREVGWIIYSTLQSKYVRKGEKYAVQYGTNVYGWVDNIQYSTIQKCNYGWIIYRTVQYKNVRMGG